MGLANPDGHCTLPYIYMYYSYNNILSYRQPIKAIVGGEGIGKTYGLKERFITEWLNTTEHFQVIWFIRYDVDITPEYIEKWVDDLPIDFKQRLKVDGRVIKFDDEDFIYFKALSKFIVGKGIPYPNVKHAVFDEFILDKDSRYLKNEIFAFKRWTQSIFRLRPVSWWLLANALSFDNPYFNYFNVKKYKDKEWFSNDKIVVHFPPANKEFLKSAINSDYYKLFNDEETQRYGLNAEFYFDNEEFLCSQPTNAQPTFKIKTGKQVFSVWKTKTMYWVSSRNVATKQIYALTKSDVSPVATYNSAIINALQTLYTQKLLYFENLTIKNLVLEKIKCL